MNASNQNTISVFLTGSFSEHESRLIDAAIRISERRSHPLIKLDEDNAHLADVVVIDCKDCENLDINITNAPWLQEKTIISIDETFSVHTSSFLTDLELKRPVQWTNLSGIIAEATHKVAEDDAVPEPQFQAAKVSPEPAQPSAQQSAQQPVPQATQTTPSAAPSPTTTPAPPRTTPTHTAQSQPAPPSVATPSPQATVTANSAGNRLLIVDDSESIRRHMSMLMERKGVTVATASNAEEATQLATREPFDCILMDVVMPGASGYDACRQIKAAFSKGLAPPIIMLTSKSTPFDQIKGKMAGCDAYLTKPTTMPLLTQALAEHTKIKLSDG